MKHLLLLHGALGHPDDFAPYEQELSRHFTLHKLLFAGHGDSALPETLRMEHYVQQLADYVDAHRLKELHVFGYSMGGYVALCYALQQPERIASLLTLATKLRWTAEGAAKEAGMLQPAVISEKVPKYAARLQARHGTEKWQDLLPAIGNMMKALGAAPLLDQDRYGSIDARVQLMVGDNDTMVSLEETLEAARSIPDARLAVLPQTKHPLDQVRPGLLLGMMKDFWPIG